MWQCPILVVDDDADIRDALWGFLDQEGFRVYEASDGREALRVLERMGRSCIILLDLTMPAMKGEEFLQQLTDTYPGGWPHKVVVITADAQNGARRVSGFPVEAVVLKPFNEPKLLGLLRQNIE